MTSESDPNSIDGLSPSGVNLVQTLSQHGARGGELANFYIGAVRVLSDESNPERFAQSALSVSELLEKLPDLVTDERPTNTDVAGRLRRLGKSLETARDDSLSFNEGWAGQIDEPLIRFLNEAFEILLSDDAPHDTRREIFLTASARLGGYQGVLPDNIRDQTSDQRHTYVTYFTDVRHHRGRPIDAVEFDENLVGVADYLSSILRPPAFAEQRRLDELIRTGERDAD